MTHSITTVMKLPRSTGECDVGPELSLRNDHLSIRYDNEGDEGVVWTELQFMDVAAMRLTPDIAITQEFLSAYSKVCELVPSPWLQELQSRVTEGDLSRYRHFLVYFDHHFGIEVIAVAVRLC